MAGKVPDGGFDMVERMVDSSAVFSVVIMFAGSEKLYVARQFVPMPRRRYSMQVTAKPLSTTGWPLYKICDDVDDVVNAARDGTTPLVRRITRTRKVTLMGTGKMRREGMAWCVFMLRFGRTATDTKTGFFSSQ